MAHNSRSAVLDSLKLAEVSLMILKLLKLVCWWM